MGDNTREAAKIESADIGPEDHGILTVFTHVAWPGAGQGFGGLALGHEGDSETPLLDDYVRDLCQTFDAEKPRDLVGKACVVLRCFPDWDSMIEGLEAPSGKRFTHTSWRRKHWPHTTKDPLEERIERLKSSIKHSERRRQEMIDELATVRGRYVSWEPHK